MTDGTRLTATESKVRPSVWMVAGAMCFASMGAMTHALGDRCDWLVVGLVRAAFMCGTAVLLARLSGVRLVVWRPRTLWVRSLAGSFSLVCNFYALARLPVADALTLSHTYPLWIVLLTAVAVREPPSRWEWLGVLCGVAGIVLIEQPHLEGDRLATFVALLSAGSTAVAMLGLNRLRSVGALAVMAHFAGVATVVSAAGVLARPGVFASLSPNPATLSLLLGVAITGTAGQYCLTKAYTRGKPARLAVVGLTQVVFALGFDLALWGRRLDATMGLGFVLVLAPSAWLAGLTSVKLASLGRTSAAAGHALPDAHEGGQGDGTMGDDLGASVAAPEEVL
jgi:drug/metabolite transporter (DMT)-like permease